MFPKDRKFYCVREARRESEWPRILSAMVYLGGRRLRISRKRSGLEVTRVQSLPYDMSTAVRKVFHHASGQSQA